MNKYNQSNREAIRRGLKTLTISKDTIINLGLYNLMEAAIQKVIEEHEEFHNEHPSFPDFHGEMDNDTLAAGVSHKGDILDIWSQVKGQDVPYNVASVMMENLLSGNQNAWVGSILSGMIAGDDPPRAYREEYEVMFLEHTIEWVRQHWDEYFKPIS